MPVTTPTWQEVWRQITPRLPTKGLENLLIALESDDPRITQIATVLPGFRIGFLSECKVASACPISFCGWQSDEVGDQATNKEVEEFFVRTVLGVKGIDILLGFIDRTSRYLMRKGLAEEVRLELTNRGMVVVT